MEVSSMIKDYRVVAPVGTQPWTFRVEYLKVSHLSPVISVGYPAGTLNSGLAD
jgi:hypothetical protein